jgi:hypothetical protein
MTTASIIRKPMPRKPPAKRLFFGVVGSPLVKVLESAPVEATPESAPKTAAAIRAAKWREKQKQQDPDFSKKEAKRKQTEREESERKQQLEEVLDSGQFPVNLVALRKKDGKRLFLKDAPRGKGAIVTGGYDTAEMDAVATEHDRAKGGQSVFRAPAKAVVPEGHGPDSTEPDIPSLAYKYLPPREIRVMHSFIQNHTTESPMLVCLICREQIAPEFSFEAGFNHLHDKHPDQFKQMMERVKRTAAAKRCPNDHEGMAARHGNGAKKLYCGRCRKLLYKPPKQMRSDKPSGLPKAA